MSKAKRVVAMLVLGVGYAAVGMAHHSFAMFDSAKTITSKGVVKEVQWTNPHVWVRITVTEKGKPMLYSYEAAAIAVLKRVGWTKESVKAGDVVTVVGHPYKDGRVGGSVDHLILADGRQIGTGDAIPPALIVPGAAP